VTASLVSRVASGSTDRPVLAAGAAALGVLVVSAGADDGIVLCPFRRCTGGYCPGCGATRGANRLLHGDLAGSWTHHPWIVLAAVQLVIVGSAAALMKPATRLDRLRRGALPLLVANSVVLVGIWIIRLAGGSIPGGWLF
jgi:hypothetical protein